MTSVRRLVLAAAPVVALFLAMCGGTPGASHDPGAPPDAGPPDGESPDAEQPSDGGLPDAPEPPVDVCASLGLPKRSFTDGPYGVHRGEIAEDFTVALVDGTSWSLRDRWSGCESYLFVPDTLPVSDLDPTSVWEHDLDGLVQASPLNVHYFFVSRATTAAAADEATSAMQARVEGLLTTLSADDAAHWRDRLHVLKAKAGDLGNWVKDLLQRNGRIGFGIDRSQRVRGVGLLADVSRFDPALQQADKWPWEANLAYMANEARYFNAEEDRRTRLDSEAVTAIPLWNGEVLSEFAETDVLLPTAEQMAGFDTLEIEVSMSCPDENQLEFGNCGAWDYIASLAVKGEAGNIELARFITSYHRETHWVVDATPMLPHLLAGGQRHFRWDFAPSWNTQPTATRLSLRLSNRSKGMAPVEATFLYGGGPFNSMYNATRVPVEVAIPADAKRVELVAIITGHGGATNDCAEFCDHQHEFVVNNAAHLYEFPSAGTTDGCIGEIENGMVPNQGGTWWFGRGGWCPGKQVDPWIVDITGDVTPGTTATISYRGLYGNGTPPDDAGDINMVSYLITYR